MAIEEIIADHRRELARGKGLHRRELARGEAQPTIKGITVAALDFAPHGATR